MNDVAANLIMGLAVLVLLATGSVLWARFLRRTMNGDAGLRTEAVEYGDGLVRLPDPVLQLSYEDWAAETWAGWEAGTSSFGQGSYGGPAVCPACYYVGLTGQSAFLAASHPLPEAANRWRNSAAIEKAQAAALGSCRCGKGLTSSEAAVRSANMLGRYL